MSQSEIYTRIRAEMGSAVLVAVSKTVSADRVEELYRLGHRDFGENYVQELLAKANELERRGITDIRWHFIGHLQTNKVKQVVGKVHSVHSVDSLRLAQELGKRWQESGRPGRLPIFLEVNVDGEQRKAGVTPDEAVPLARELASIPGLELRGLMCIPQPGQDEPALRQRFARLRELEQKARPATAGDLSMGMSADYPLALAEGATHVRLGTVLFGARTSSPAQGG